MHFMSVLQCWKHSRDLEEIWGLSKIIKGFKGFIYEQL